MEKEIWKKIPGLPRYYEASSLSRIRTVNHSVLVRHHNGTIIKKKLKGQIIKQSKSTKGYFFFVAAPGHSKKKTVLVHRALWAAFRGPVEGLTINHKDFNPGNNNLDNLELVTLKENINYSIRSGRIFGAMSRRKLTDLDVSIIKASKRKRRELAKLFRVTTHTIKRIREGRLHSRIEAYNGK